MKTLTLEHLCGYLPFGLKVVHEMKDKTAYLHVMGIHDDGGRIRNEGEADNDPDFSLAVCWKEKHKYRSNGYFYIQANFKPILRPLPQLTEEIEHNGERFVPIEVISDELHTIYYEDGILSDEMGETEIKWLPFAVIQKFYEWHFDIHNLIPAGLAVSYKEAGI